MSVDEEDCGGGVHLGGRQAPGQRDKLVGSRTLMTRTDLKNGGLEAQVCIYRMTQQLLSPVFSLFL